MGTPIRAAEPQPTMRERPARVLRRRTASRVLVRAACLVGLAVGATVAGAQMPLPPTRSNRHATVRGEPSALVGALDPPALAPGTALWAKDALVVYSTADVASAIRTREGTGFMFHATGQAAWSADALWYEVTWRPSDPHSDGWVRAADVSVTAMPPSTAASGVPAPGAWGPASGSGALMWVSLNAYLATLGGTAGFAAYDVTRGTWYGSNHQTPFIMASSSKVVIMLTLLSETEAQGREPDGDEMTLLTTMIENSNNDSAQTLFDEIGGAPAMATFLAGASVGGIAPNADAWGYTTATPQAMVQLLSVLHAGKILTATDRSLALGLMGQVEPDQQIGVGDTAPPGATVALKDGWVPGPDGLWVVNSSGIVTMDHETYIVAIYTQHQSSLDAGWGVTRQIATMVARLLA